MKTKTLRFLSIVVSMVAAIVLAGCGGGRAESVRSPSTVVAPIDSDNDGISDDRDAFPNDPTEWADGDDNGTGDNADAVAVERLPFPFTHWTCDPALAHIPGACGGDAAVSLTNHYAGISNLPAPEIGY